MGSVVDRMERGDKVARIGIDETKAAGTPDFGDVEKVPPPAPLPGTSNLP
jgi:hypothetical protein